MTKLITTPRMTLHNTPLKTLLRYVLAGLVMAVGAPAQADGVACGFLDFVSTYELPGPAISVQVVGDSAYVLDRENGLSIFDVTTPASPLLVGSYSVGAAVDIYKSMIIDDSTAYISVRTNSSQARGALLAIDVSDPSDLTLLSSTSFINSFTYFQIQNSIAYMITFGELKTFERAFQAFDIADPSQPTLLGLLPVSINAKNIAINADIAYIADWNDGADWDNGWGVRVIDITDPTFADPTSVQLGFFETPSFFNDLQIIDNTAYVATSFDGFSIYDINDPSAVTLMGEYDPIGFPRTVSVIDSIAYIAAAGSGVEIVDISNPADPILIGTTTNQRGAQDADIVNGLAFIANYNEGLQIIDITSPSTPLLGSFDLALPDEYATTISIAIKDSIVYAASLDDGLVIVDSTIIDAPTILSTYQPKGCVWHVELVDDLAYIRVSSSLPEESGIHILDITNPADPTLIGTYLGTRFQSEFTVQSQLLYATDYDKLHIIDVSDPTQPKLVSTFSHAEPIINFIVFGTHAYLTNDGIIDDMLIIDIADPANPTLLTTVSDIPGTGVGSMAIDTDGNHVYITTYPSPDYDPDIPAGYAGGLHVIDVSDPITPQLMGSFVAEMYTRNQTIIDDIAYIPASFHGFCLIDVSNPTTPTLIGSFYPGPGSNDVEVVDSLAYISIASGQGGFSIVDVSADCGHCPADFTGDGILDFFDVSAFLQAFIAHDPIADFTDDNVWDFFDISAFLQELAAGCP